MHRRDLLKLAALTAASSPLHSAFGLHSQQSPPATPPPQDVKHVHIVFKCHLDVGFTNTQAAVRSKYFDVYYPQAISTAATLRAAGTDRFTWTTGSWLLYEYLEQATPQQRQLMEQAIAAGDITWHALPFSWQTEMLDPSMILGALSFSASLDSRFGHQTVGAKMSDVPGHSRGIISPLAWAGIKLLDIGVNAASTPPQVPAVFLWRDPAGESLIVIYHHHDYGGTLQIPGTDIAFAMEMRNDNSGPHTPTEIAEIYSRLRSQFPNATIQASSLSNLALALDPVRDHLPVITQEIGDTWIYGIPSDPPKVAQYRELARLRSQWLTDKKIALGDPTDRQLLRRLLLAVEHTWGTDTKSYLDHDHYTPHDLQLALADPIKFPGYKTMTTSWQEKRDDVTQSISSLPLALRTQAEQHLQLLVPKAPDTTNLQPLAPNTEIKTRHFILAIDPHNGAIIRLQNRKSGKEWATPSHPLALFTYQTLSAADFDHFLDVYVKSKADWAPQDFGKPNIAHFNAISKEWHPTLTKAWSIAEEHQHHIILQLKIDDPRAAATGVTGWPESLFVEIHLPDESPTLHLRLTTLNKPQNRLPESMWLTFRPQPANPESSQTGNWSLEKVGQLLLPSDVVSGGNRNMHALSEKIRFSDPSGSLEILTFDAPIVSLGERSPIYFSDTQPSLRQGIHFNLFNNAWGTNYPQWGGGDWSWRFTASFA